MYKREKHGLLKHYDFVILDMICLQIGYVLAYVMLMSGESNNPYAIADYRMMAFIIELCSFAVMYVNDTFKSVLKRGYWIEFVETFKHVIVTVSLSLFFFFIFHSTQIYSRLVIGFTFVFYYVITYIVRILWKKHVIKYNATNADKRLIVVTIKERIDPVLENVNKLDYAGYRISGLVIVDDDLSGNKINGYRVVANKDNAAMYITQHWVDEVFIAIPNEYPDYPEKLVDQLIETGVTVHVGLAKTTKVPGKKQIVEKLAGYTVLTTTMNYASPLQLMAKRLLDICGGLVGCLITAILSIFIAPAIYISSPGPIFFGQERVGQNGKKFKMYKFRSMYMDAEARKAVLMEQNKVSDGKMFKMDFDPRVIGNKILPDGTHKKGIGQFIRDTSIDEFPQFWCVLKGDMSIVGTRPPLPSEVRLYEPHHRSRLATKPGITGMWQVSGRSEITDFEEVVKLDNEYINNWSFGLDLKILFKTVKVVLTKDGSM